MKFWEGFQEELRLIPLKRKCGKNCPWYSLTRCKSPEMFWKKMNISTPEGFRGAVQEKKNCSNLKKYLNEISEKIPWEIEREAHREIPRNF